MEKRKGEKWMREKSNQGPHENALLGDCEGNEKIPRDTIPTFPLAKAASLDLRPQSYL